MHTRVPVGAWVTEYIQVSMLVNTMLCLNNRYLHIFSHTLVQTFMAARKERN